MNALVFRYSLPRLAATRLLSAVTPGAFFGPWSPLQLEDIPEPPLPAGDWLRVRIVRCGICGSDAKQAFLKGDQDNPMTALVSFPHVLGHEASGVIEEMGPAVRERRTGERIVVNPWLSCGPRGLAPPCRFCADGQYSMCERFTEGRLAPGIHAGNCADVPGAFAERIVVHETQAIPIPEGVSWEAAALADPFSVSLHSVLLSPPPEEGPAVVFGCGTLGLLTIAVLRALYPGVEVLAIAKYAHQAELARRFGAEVLPDGGDAIVEEITRRAGGTILTPWTKKPWTVRGASVVYDTVGLPQTVELSLRMASARSAIVVSGVEAPRRFEWTPLYFKEVSIIGSNAFGVETFEGRRLHAMEVYFELLERGLDVTPIITHRFPLARYREALLALRRKASSGAVKVMFTFDEGG